MSTKSEVIIKPDLKLAEPSMYKVIYFNDDVTTMDFVITSLMNHFDYSMEHAAELTARVHEEGSATVAVLPYEIAEQRSIEAGKEARLAGFPLKISVEEEFN